MRETAFFECFQRDCASKAPVPSDIENVIKGGAKLQLTIIGARGEPTLQVTGKGNRHEQNIVLQFRKPEEQSRPVSVGLRGL
jgi:invasion protein IalB